MNPTDATVPAFAMCAPFGYHTTVANNKWMEDLPDGEREPDQERAFAQWLSLYTYVAAQSLVYLLPAAAEDLQDQVFTANLGIVVDTETAILSKFQSEPRIGEEQYGRGFFESLGYVVTQPATTFEGEADLKHLYDSTYIAGYGQRTDLATHDWFRDLGLEIIPIRMDDPYLYHLDCLTFPLTREHTIVCASLCDDQELALLEKSTDIIDVSPDDAYCGITNCVRLGNMILSASDLHELERGTEQYRQERHKVRALEDIASDHGLDVVAFNLSEYAKAGALLSCLMLHLNRRSYLLSFE